MKLRRSIRTAAREQGSIAVPFAIMLPVLLGFIGMALDLSFIYSRKSELQQVADSVALAAARQLDGTLQGVNNARDAALAVAGQNKYQFKLAFPWTSSALSFSDAPATADADWKAADSIASDAMAAGLRYAKVDTSKLSGGGSNPGAVEAMFMKVLEGKKIITAVVGRAIAGPIAVHVTPLAVCALDSNPAGVRANPGIASETLEYGFRRGVSYNLLDISPNSTSPRNYLVNPVDPGDGSNNTAHFDAATMKPFFCTGSVALAMVGAGSTLYVQARGTMALQDWLNSRFDVYPSGTGCNPVTAPPDVNVREFVGGYSYWWMAATPTPYPAYAASTNRTAGGARVTFADLVATDTASDTPSAASFGPLWAYSRAQPSGAGALKTSDWPKLYVFGGKFAPAANAKYPSSDSPYLSTDHWIDPPSGATGYQDRRVLNIPLLSCPGGGPATPATVLGVGRFFMTAKATSTVVPGEFAGLLAAPGPALSTALLK